ncbi:zinc finger protein 646-like [Rhynchophorus ferrugineus]|uniref:zinc finger protein 646-like n=1 Tax=Rhynchophorus ferrugineus TaxID=354439 RepID=UPI003FCE2048
MDSIDPLGCKTCGKTFKHRSSLYNHTQYTCGKGPSYFCIYCPFRTKYIYHIQQHMHFKHNMDLSRKALKPFRLNTHTIARQDAAHLAIPIVELQEKSAGILSSLYLIKDEDKVSHKKPSTRIRGNFTCAKCNRIYIRKDSLQRHQTYECDKEPQFPCPFCPQKCKRRTHLLRHIKRQHPDQLGILQENNPELKTEILGHVAD